LPACAPLVEVLEPLEPFFADELPEEPLLCASATAPASKIVPRIETVVFIPKSSPHSNSEWLEFGCIQSAPGGQARVAGESSLWALRENISRWFHKLRKTRCPVGRLTSAAKALVIWNRYRHE
jgi:hypothetical protein